MIIFLAIVLSIIIPFNSVFVDLIRLDTSGSILNRNVENANMSVLADYNGRLYDEYGLYGLYETDKNIIKNKVMKYIKLNMDSDNDVGLYQNEIIEMKCEFTNFTLSELKKQILDYVKYRIPVDTIQNLIEKIIASGDTKFINNTQDIETSISKYEDYISDICREYNDAVRKLNSFPDDFNNIDTEEVKDLSQEYLSYLDDADKRLNKLYNASADVKGKIRDLELKLYEYKKEAPHQSSYIRTLENRINKLNEGLINEEFYTKNISNISANRQLFTTIINSKKEDDEGDEEYKIRLIEISNDFIPIELTDYKIPRYSSGDERYDTRDENTESLKKILSKDDDDKSKRITEKQKVNLPSYKLKFDDFAKKIKGDPEDISLEDEYFSKDSLSQADNIFSGVKTNLINLYEEILINEYIISTFKSAVLKDSENKFYTDLKGRTLASRETFLDNEVEYILNGWSKDSENLFIVKAELYLFRFCMNTLHVYMDAEKKALAESAALAVTALLGGAGSSLIANLILWGWSMGESCIDISDLLKGKKVPIYKSKNEWKLDIGIFKPGDDKSSFSISYRDYLRILLLMVPMDVKLARIADLIQLNTSMWKSNFKLLDTVTGIKTKVYFSEKILFPIMNLYPSDILADERRFKIYVEKYSEYN